MIPKPESPKPESPRRAGKVLDITIAPYFYPVKIVGGLQVKLLELTGAGLQ